MGNNCIIDMSRHNTTRQIFSGQDNGDPSQQIMGANTDVTDMVEQYRQTIREAGVPQAPAPTEQIDTI